MNVLHVNQNFSGTGAQRVSLMVLASAPAQGKYFCAQRDESLSETFVRQLREAGIEPIEVRGLSNGRFLLLPLAIWALVRIIRSRRVDVVHSHSFLAGVAARTAALLTRTPCVHTFHGAPSRAYRRVAFAICRLVEATLARITRVVVFNSAHQARLILGRRGDGARVIFNAIPPLAVSARPRAQPRRNVLFVGRFEFQKNPEFFVQLAVRTGPDLSFRMIGGGALEPAVDALNRTLAAGVDIRGFSEDPSADYDWADVVVVCSRYESFGLVIGEALAAGCAVVASCVDGLDEIWGDAVCFYREGSLEDAAAALARARLAGDVSTRARAALGRFGEDEFARQYRAVYEDVLGRALPREEVGTRRRAV